MNATKKTIDLAEWTIERLLDLGRDEMDEVAICFATENELESFLGAAKREGMEHFNTVPSDVMRRQDQPGESFEVRFEFLRAPGDEWRIEAMCVLSGSAPLHEAALAEYGSPVVIHVSHKMKSLVDYEMEVRRRLQVGHVRIAEYANTYGMFSYWSETRGLDGEEHTTRLPYIKPRVNLRD